MPHDRENETVIIAYTTGMAESFTALLERARTGDPAAVAALVQQYEPEIRVVARLRLGHALRPYLDSMDLVQSVHRSLIRGLQDQRFTITEPQQLVALALTMVRRKAARVWRKQRRQQRGGDVLDLGEMFANLSESGSDPTLAVEHRETLDRLNTELDPLDKQILELHLLGYRTTEIARLLKRDADSLRVRVSRLRLKLRALPFIQVMAS